MNFIKSLFLTSRFFYALASIIVVMMLSYAFPFLFAVAKTSFVLFIVLACIDAILLYNKRVVIDVQRETPSVLSLGDNNVITLSLLNKSPIKIGVELIDELP